MPRINGRREGDTQANWTFGEFLSEHSGGVTSDEVAAQRMLYRLFGEPNGSSDAAMDEWFEELRREGERVTEGKSLQRKHLRLIFAC